MSHFCNVQMLNFISYKKTSTIKQKKKIYWFPLNLKLNLCMLYFPASNSTSSKEKIKYQKNHFKIQSLYCLITIHILIKFLNQYLSATAMYFSSGEKQSKVTELTYKKDVKWKYLNDLQFYLFEIYIYELIINLIWGL